MGILLAKCTFQRNQFVSERSEIISVIAAVTVQIVGKNLRIVVATLTTFILLDHILT